MTNKTALEWFKQLPEPYRTQAIENSTRPDSVYPSLARALVSNFTWESAPQKNYYWHDIYERAELGEFDTPQANLNGWIPVSERLPSIQDSDELGDVLILTDGVKKIANWLEIKPKNITHWQPLPKLPENSEQEVGNV